MEGLVQLERSMLNTNDLGLGIRARSSLRALSQFGGIIELLLIQIKTLTI